MSELLSVRDLSVTLRGGRQPVVEGLSFDVAAGEIFCIVGESGSGKSITAKSLLGLLPRGAATSGSALFRGTDLLSSGHAEATRGRGIGMIFQEPMTALNPVLSIGRQLTEASVTFGDATQREADARAIELLARVGIDGGPARLRQYPHELSGGMRQRVTIAMAMMREPALLIADEPTTALDVTVQAQILELLKALIRDTGMGLVLITHDMGVVAETADRVLVMQRGRAVETRGVHALFAAPEKPYTRRLLAAVPRLDVAGSSRETASTPAGDPVVRVENVCKRFGRRAGRFRLRAATAGTVALDHVSLTLERGETLALVGESGSGKSTLGRAIARLANIDEGRVLVDGEDISRLRGAALRAARGRTQMIFQDPYSSLDPRFSIGRTIAEPMIIRGASRAEAQRRARALLERVGLAASLYERFPHEFSGGQRQRIAIARALATDPAVLVADEPTSALDVSIQARVLDLLRELKAERALAMLFISHDLAVVRSIADRVAVMRAGRILETGPTEAVLAEPRHRYTRTLVASAPVPDPRERDARARPAALPSGASTEPLREVAPGHWVAA